MANLIIAPSFFETLSSLRAEDRTYLDVRIKTAKL
jgi:hypothetical protein